METSFVDLTQENLAQEHLCCIIRSRKPHPGVEAKRQWISERLKDGHVFRKYDAKECAFIEYAPLETAWVPIVGENYLYLYCLWVTGAPKGHGYGRALMESCIADARAQGRSGICMLGAKKQKAWLSNQSFAKKFGFGTVDSTPGGYELLAYLSIRATQLGLKACEVPVTRAYPATGKTPTKISGFKGNSDLMKVLLNALAGKYNP